GRARPAAAAGARSCGSRPTDAARSCVRSARSRGVQAESRFRLYRRSGMFLNSLTLKGFKSFAEHTSLAFEPGVTIVVGPNGSGKSNLVDAVAWVLGAQG